MRNALACSVLVAFASVSSAQERPALPDAPPPQLQEAPPLTPPVDAPPPWMPPPPPCCPSCCAPPPPCTGVWTPPQLTYGTFPPDEERKRLLEEQRHDAAVGFAIGSALFLVGEGLSLAHVLDTHPQTSWYELTPVVGPAVALFREQPDSGWASGLVFASWFQAAGIVVLAAAGAAWSASSRIEPTASIEPHGASFGLKARFVGP
jgi:hypothetical protein